MTDSRHELEARGIHARIETYDRLLSAADDALDDLVRHGREVEASALRQVAALVRTTKADLTSLARELEAVAHDLREVAA